MNLVIVESPSKSKVIQKYLGKEFKVIASGGHIRELDVKNKAVNTSDFSMRWTETNKKKIKNITDHLHGVNKIYLATDPDREGEAISWHILEVLKKCSDISMFDISRVTFNSITRDAINEAFKKPKPLNNKLIDAYMARIAIDYLVGFNLSPVLWRKLPGSKSAGRVQSVALKLIVEREKEIFLFNSQEYWTVEGVFDKNLSCSLTHLSGEKLSKFDIKNEGQCKEIVESLKNKSYLVSEIKSLEKSVSPNPPFNTASLQQFAFNYLSMSAVSLMKTAQELYEGIDIGDEKIGLITYMRTDSVFMEDSAVNSCRSYIKNNIGDDYLNGMVRKYKNKSKNAQEAHEAIRPTDFLKTPEEIKQYLNSYQYKVYSAIWSRSIASQMSNALYESKSIYVSSKDKDVFVGKGSKLIFDGYLKVVKENSDKKDIILSDFKLNESINYNDISGNQHFTSPPARYNEGSLIKKLEEMGIGRPSTYARILQVLKERSYVSIDKKQMIPESRGIVVTEFLQKFFTFYVEYDFTANLEDQLDNVAIGSINRLNILESFWKEFHCIVEQGYEVPLLTVLENLTDKLKIFFNKNIKEKDRLICPKCRVGELSLKVGKFGIFWGCSQYTNKECDFLSPFSLSKEVKPVSTFKESKNTILISDEDLSVELCDGPYGRYLKYSGSYIKDNNIVKSKLAKSHSVKNISLKSMGINDSQILQGVSREKFLMVLHLPRKLQNGIELCLGKYGPYVQTKKGKSAVPENQIFNIDENFTFNE